MAALLCRGAFAKKVLFPCVVLCIPEATSKETCPFRAAEHPTSLQCKRREDHSHIIMLKLMLSKLWSHSLVSRPQLLLKLFFVSLDRVNSTQTVPNLRVTLSTSEVIVHSFAPDLVHPPSPRTMKVL